MSGHQEISPALGAQVELQKTTITDFNASRYTSGTSSLSCKLCCRHLYLTSQWLVMVRRNLNDKANLTYKSSYSAL